MMSEELKRIKKSILTLEILRKEMADNKSLNDVDANIDVLKDYVDEVKECNVECLKDISILLERIESKIKRIDGEF